MTNIDSFRESHPGPTIAEQNRHIRNALIVATGVLGATFGISVLTGEASDVEDPAQTPKFEINNCPDITDADPVLPDLEIC